MFINRENKNTLFFILLCVLIQVILFSFVFFSNKTSLRLEQVVILSRHNVRSPLSKNLEKITTQRWPQWREMPGYLTARGFMLEGYMGKYFSNWLYKEGILTKKCPSDKEFFICANSMQRTLFSAKAFIDSAFPNCNITVHTATNETGPIFSSFIHNASETFKDIALKEMKNVLDSLNLTTSYFAMENILDYKNSEFCKVDNKCSLVNDENKLYIAVGEKPKVKGPLKICNEAIDAFLMAYYNGYPLQDIGWGKLDTLNHWDSISGITAGYHNVAFNTTHVAKDISGPLLKYMKHIFINNNSKVTLLMGHDANINVLLNTMSFKSYKLVDNFVSTPIGGKVVFQKWYNSKIGKYFLKIEYVFQTNQQLRNAEVLTFNNPPNFSLLQLKYCRIDDNGFCLWDDFISFLNSL